VDGTVVQVAGGNSHTGALLDTGTVRCWGRGDRGQLDYGNTDHIGLNDTSASAGDVDVGARIRSATLMVSSTDTMTRCAMSSAVNSSSAM
jgi:alpha-tubulin suppressor-like RCC1 family protein